MSKNPSAIRLVPTKVGRGLLLFVALAVSLLFPKGHASADQANPFDPDARPPAFPVIIRQTPLPAQNPPPTAAAATSGTAVTEEESGKPAAAEETDRTIEVTAPAGGSDAHRPADQKREDERTTPPVIFRDPAPLLLAARIGFSETLVIGEHLTSETEKKATCLSEKPSRNGRFCVLPVEWSNSLRPHMQGATVLHGGNNAIGRVEDGVLRRLYASFQSAAFPTIAAHLETLLGPPTSILERKLRSVEGLIIDNTVMRWRKPGHGGKGATVLEISRHDTIRRVFPDKNNGTIRAFDEDSTPIFADVSPLDFMTIR